MASDGISIMLNSVVELSLLYIHGLHSVLSFFLAKLIIDDLLKTHSFVVQQSYQTVIIAFVTNDVIAVLAKVVNVQLMEDHVAWSSHFDLQVESNVHESEVTIRLI